jgi:hypothetical protein
VVASSIRAVDIASAYSSPKTMENVRIELGDVNSKLSAPRCGTGTLTVEESGGPLQFGHFRSGYTYMR